MSTFGYLIAPALMVLAFLFFGRELADAIRDGIDNFRGGPPTPMHPSPAGDSALLRRRSRRTKA